jgi:hypothetical protein
MLFKFFNTNLDKSDNNLDRIKTELRQNLDTIQTKLKSPYATKIQTKFRQNLDKIQTKFRLPLLFFMILKFDRI